MPLLHSLAVLDGVTLLLREGDTVALIVALLQMDDDTVPDALEHEDSELVSVGLEETLALREGDMDELKVLVLQGEALTVPEDVEHTEAESVSVGLVETLALSEEEMEADRVALLQIEEETVPEALTDDVSELDSVGLADTLTLSEGETVPEKVALLHTLCEGVEDVERLPHALGDRVPVTLWEGVLDAVPQALGLALLHPLTLLQKVTEEDAVEEAEWLMLVERECVSVTLGQPLLEVVGEVLGDMLSVGEPEAEGEVLGESLCPPAEPNKNSGSRRAPRMAVGEGGCNAHAAHERTKKEKSFLFPKILFPFSFSPPFPPSPAMHVVYVKTLWGVSPQMGNAPLGYSGLFKRLKGEGFHAVETPVWMIADKAAFRAALDEHAMGYVAMINTCTPDYSRGVGATYERPSQKLEEHLASFEAQVAEALTLRPLKINSHSGCDLWPLETSRAFFTRALEIEKACGLQVCHETHRGRVLYNPWVTRDLCRAFPELKLTADLSHFAVVAERVFHDGDEDWKACMAEIARATKHIHARVGYSQGPQVPDPRAPEYQSALEHHERWWDQILSTAAAQGVPMMTLEPEHGTDGYRASAHPAPPPHTRTLTPQPAPLAEQKLPYTEVETADIWKINSWIRARQEERLLKAPWALKHAHKE